MKNKCCVYYLFCCKWLRRGFHTFQHKIAQQAAQTAFISVKINIKKHGIFLSVYSGSSTTGLVILSNLQFVNFSSSYSLYHFRFRVERTIEFTGDFIFFNYILSIEFFLHFAFRLKYINIYINILFVLWYLLRLRHL